MWGERWLTVKPPGLGSGPSGQRRARRRGVRLRQVAGRGFVQPALGRAALEHEAAIAVAAVDVALLVDLHVDARVAERGRAVVGSAADVAGAVAPYPRSIDQGGFGDLCHRPRVSRTGPVPQCRRL